MAEHGKAPESEAEEGGVEAASPVALELALNGLGSAGLGDHASSAEAAAFLIKQTRMLDMQMEHLHEQRELNLNHMRWRKFGDRVTGALQVLGLAAGAGVICGVLAMAWSASRDRSLVIDPFSTPPGLAQRGVTGAVVAAHVLDQLNSMQERTDSGRAPDTYLDQGESEIKLEIPETGITIGELQHALVQWLGHRQHITGEIYETAKGLTLTARAGEAAGATFTDPGGDPAVLVGHAAEAIYRETQPYRYGVYLWQTGRDGEASQVFEELATQGPLEERPWAYFGWGGVLGAAGDVRGQAQKARAGLDINPRLAAGWQTLALAEEAMGHAEAARAAWAGGLEALDHSKTHGLTPRPAAQSRLLARARLQEARADFLGAAQTWRPSARLADYRAMGSEAEIAAAIDLAWAHDLSQVAAAESSVARTEEAPILLARLAVAAAEGSGRWTGVAARLEDLQGRLAEATHARRLESDWTTTITPWQAYAQLKAGDAGRARATLEATPLDCTVCLILRGRIAVETGDAAGGERWLRQAVAQAPSSPQAQLELGRALGSRGNVAGAEAAFAAASRIAPNWADPKLALGESLIRRGQAAEGRAALQAAARLAPAWSRPGELLAQK